jgi:tetratricopeptide (TPR) repeat protein
MRKSDLMFLILMAAAAVQAQEMDPADLEGRIEYAYFTADANALRNLVSATQNSMAKGSSSALAHYQRGHVHYRLGQVLEAQNDAKAPEAFSACVDALGKAIDADKQFAEAYALQSACYTSLAELKAWKVVVDLPLGGSRLDKALKLAPKSPRVALVDALNDYERPRGLGGDRKRACSKFEKAAQLFDASPDETQLPAWGAADAYLYVGRCLDEGGDVLGARSALERALIIAPDFAAARAELRRVIAPKS